MISRFTVHNFKSIQDLTVSFSFAEGKAPNGYRELEQLIFCESKKGRRLVPCLALYGANASGKTNIIMALQTLQQLVSANPLSVLYYPNKLALPTDSTSFELELDIKGTLLTYSISYTQTEILSESLLKNGENIYSITKCKPNFSGIKHSKTSKIYTNKVLIDIFCTECMENGFHIFPLLHRFAKNYPGLNDSIRIVYHAIINMLIPLRNEFPVSLGIDFIAKKDDKDGLKEALNRITCLLKTLDIDIVHMDINRVRMDKKDCIQPRRESTIVCKNGISYEDSVYSYHIDRYGNEIKFNFMTEESSGTQIAAGLIAICLGALDTGNILIVDEMDRSLHPLVFKEIVSLFKDKRYNTNNSQLLLTSHNTELLDEDILRVSEVGIINKTKNDGTTLCRISDFSGVRNVTNFRKQYLQGSFRGLPNAYI